MAVMLKLNACLVRSNVISVVELDILSSSSPHQLKKAILGKKEYDLETIGRIPIYKVKLPGGVIEGKAFAQRANEELDKLKKTDQMAGLDAMGKLEYVGPISDYWNTEQDLRTVHILVEMPHDDDSRPIKRPRVAEVEQVEADSDIYKLWKYWWRPQGTPETSMPPLWKKETVLRAESRFDDEPISNECKVLRFENSFMPVYPILFRKEYDIAMEYVKEQYVTLMWGRLIICGHPGIGKTSLLKILLLDQLRHGNPVLFYQSNGLFFFNDKGVIVIPEDYNPHKLLNLIPPRTWALIDAGDDFTSPPSAIMDPSGRLDPFFILASSPRAIHWSHWKVKITRQIFFYMKPWTWEEIVHARSFQKYATQSLMDEQQLRRLFDRFGPSARMVYETTSHDDYKVQVEDTLDGLDVLELGTLMKKYANAETDISHKLLLVECQSDGERQFAEARLVTPYVTGLLVRVKRKKEAQALERFYELLLQSNRTRSAAGMLLEELVHVIGEAGAGPFPLRSMTPTTHAVNAIYRPAASQASHQLDILFRRREIRAFSRLSDVLQRARLSENFYYVPASKTQGAIDSFVFDERQGSAPLLTFFQVTVSPEHDLLESVVSEIDESLRAWTPAPAHRYVIITSHDNLRPAITIPKKWNDLTMLTFSLSPSEAAQSGP